jgi:hypothetical protein
MALASAVLFGASTPFAKLLLGDGVKSFRGCSLACCIWGPESASPGCSYCAGLLWYHNRRPRCASLTYLGLASSS